jgi:hypothetical protein
LPTSAESIPLPKTGPASSAPVSSAAGSNSTSRTGTGSSVVSTTPPPECGSCEGCLGVNSVCYPESKAYCDLYPVFKWCGALVEEEPSPELEAESEPEAAPSPEPEAELESETPASLPEICGSCSGCLAVDGLCYVESKAFCDLHPLFTWCGTPADVSVAPSPAPTRAPVHKQCGSCNGCLARNGVCYPETKDHCDLYFSFTWCGELARVNLLRNARRVGQLLEAVP